MTAQAAVVLTSNATRSGILSTLSPWQLVIASIVLILLAGAVYWVKEKKLSSNFLILNIVTLILGAGGLIALVSSIVVPHCVGPLRSGSRIGATANATRKPAPANT